MSNNKESKKNDFTVKYKPKTTIFGERCYITFDDGREYPIGDDVYRAMKYHFLLEVFVDIKTDIKTVVQCRTIGCELCAGILEKWEKRKLGNFDESIEILTEEQWKAFVKELENVKYDEKLAQFYSEIKHKFKISKDVKL